MNNKSIGKVASESVRGYRTHHRSRPPSGRYSRTRRMRRTQRNLAVFCAAGTLIGMMAAGVVHFTVLKVAIGALIGLAAGLILALLID